MRFIDLRHLSGPNVFSRNPACVARLELDELTGQETTAYPGFADRLTTALPGLAGHHCAAGRPGGFIAAMRRGTYFGHVTEHIALELSSLAGRDVHLGRTMWAGADGRYDLMMECPLDEPADSAVPGRLIRLAISMTLSILAGPAPGFSAELAEIAQLVERERLGVSTAAIAAAARGRTIPVRRIGRRSMLQLGYGCHRRLICAALTDQTSAVGVDIADDKMLTKELLATAGIRVADGIVADSAQDAINALQQLGPPVVIKPLGGNHGRHVSIGVRTSQQAAAAYDQASSISPAVLVETFVPGTDYRVLIIDGQVAAAAELRPASVTGDGCRTISQLVDRANADPRRGIGHARELTRIVLDEAALTLLDARGMDGCSVPAPGEAVTLRKNANLSTGGTSRDVTDEMHADVAEMCRRAAAACGLDVCGIDLRLADISAPLLGQDGQGHWPPGAVIEVNACPGLRMHLSPAEGRARDVAAAMVDRLFPPGAPARIPLIAVTGTNGKTTTVRMIGHVLRQAGLRVGMATTDGVYAAGRLIHDADASGPRSAAMVLGDPTIEAAVLETARGGIIRRGLGYDQADVAVVTNITADHLGSDGVDDLDELIHVKALVAEEIGDGASVVLNADDPATASIADRPAVRRHTPVIRYFSLVPGNPVITRHAEAGGISYEMRDGQLVEIESGRQRPLISAAELPGAFGGRAAHLVANALAAAAACRAAGVSAKDIRQALSTFTPDEANPGRGNFYRAGRSPLIVDYGHNAAALAATGRMIANVWAAGAVAAVTLPGDRRDDLVTDTAAAIASWFGRVVVYEDSDRRGRPAGQMREMISAEIRRVRPDVICEHADGPHDAVARAVALAGGGPVLFLYEKLAVARDALAAIGAEPWPYADVARDAARAPVGQDDTVTIEALADDNAKRIPERWSAGDASADYELMTRDRPAAAAAAELASPEPAAPGPPAGRS